MTVLDVLTTDRESSTPFWVDDTWAVDSDLSESSEVRQYDDEDYYCETIHSNNKKWFISYCKSINSTETRVFLYHLGELVFTSRVESPTKGAVTDDGMSCIISEKTGGIGGKLICFSNTGQKKLAHDFESNPESINLDSEGTLAAVTTLPPDDSIYIFDLDNYSEPVTIEKPVDRVSDITVYRNDDDVVFLMADGTGEPTVAVDASGELFWDDRSHEKGYKSILRRVRDLF